MKIKMVDVARYLGISKATVSLAVHGKPGVSEETRQKVLKCIDEMEKNGGKPLEESSSFARSRNEETKQTPTQMIKVVIVNHRKKVVCDPELDLWSATLATFDREARERSYYYGLTYLNDSKEEREAVLLECNSDIVAGVILFATELQPEDMAMLEEIHKPIVLYDYEDGSGRYSSVCIDNKAAVERALDILYGAGATDIKYFRTGKDIYNFKRRRETFFSSLVNRNQYPAKSDMVELGDTIPEITEQFLTWLEGHALPEALLFENYQISIGVMTALKRKGIRVPEQVKVVGIDEIPETILPDISLTQIQIPHAERASMSIHLLDQEITGAWNTDVKIKVFAEPKVIRRNSV